MSLKGSMDLKGSKDVLHSETVMCLGYSRDLDEELRRMKGFEVDCYHPGLRIP